MVYIYWALALILFWFVFGVISLWYQWDYIHSHMARLIRQWERLHAIPDAERSQEDQADFIELSGELRDVVIAVCIWCGPVVAIPAALAWIKGELRD